MSRILAYIRKVIKPPKDETSIPKAGEAQCSKPSETPTPKMSETPTPKPSDTPIPKPNETPTPKLSDTPGPKVIETPCAKASEAPGSKPDETSCSKADETTGPKAAETTDPKASEPSEDAAPGTVVLLESTRRKVIIEPGDIVLKAGDLIYLSEAEAIKVASEAGLPAPVLHGVSKSDKITEIRMSLIPGQTLDKLWPSLPEDQRKDIAKQLGRIIEKMRALEPPPGYIGCCDGSGIRDTRVRFTYNAPPCATEAEFNDYLESSLFRPTPAVLRAAFRSQLRTSHRIVFSHGDLAPRNILVEDGKITGIVDWEDSGWYPEYWELVKFFERPASWEWKALADIIFPEQYPSELVTYTAMSKWRHG